MYLSILCNVTPIGKVLIIVHLKSMPLANGNMPGCALSIMLPLIKFSGIIF